MSSTRPEDEDELDDLDDLLDDFADEVLSKPPGEASSSTETTQPKVESVSEDDENAKTKGPAKDSIPEGSGLKDIDVEKALPELDNDFAKTLNLGMDEILGEMENDPEAKKAFEALLSGMAQNTGTDGGDLNKSNSGQQKNSSSSAGNKAGADQEPAQNFQETISKTMNRLKESGKEMDDQQGSNQQAGGMEQDFMAKMMKELENASGENVDMSNLLDEMLEELSSKEILYEPMKEMHDKYPEWLRKNENNISKDELERFKKQQQIVDEICAKFEDPNYSDDDEACRKYISERMELMQKSGAPPNELMGDLTSGSIPGMDFGEGGMPKLPDELENCNVQ